MFSFSRQSEKRLVGVKPDLVFVFREALVDSPLDFGIAQDGGVRTAARQSEMFLDPRIKTNADGFIQLSDHQIKPGEHYGHALDFFVLVDGAVTWDKRHYAIVGGHILGTANRLRRLKQITIDLKWGATFGSSTYHGWDMGHMGIQR